MNREEFIAICKSRDLRALRGLIQAPLDTDVENERNVQQYEGHPVNTRFTVVALDEGLPILYKIVATAVYEAHHPGTESEKEYSLSTVNKCYKLYVASLLHVLLNCHPGGESFKFA